MNNTLLLPHFDLLATAPSGVARLRELILTLAVQGKLVPQDPADEPASELLKRIRAEKDRLIAEGKIKRDKPLAPIGEDEQPFELPVGWAYCRLGALLLSIRSGGTPSKQNPAFWDGDIPWASVKDLRFGEPVSDTQDRITQAGLCAGSELAPAGSILICTRMGLGKIGEALLDVAINQDLKAVSLGTGIDKQYFINYFKTLAVVGSGMTVAGIKQEELLGFVVPLPPETEQVRIVARVEELMRVCDALETQGRLQAAQHTLLVNTLLATLAASATPEELANNWQRVAQHFDTLLDRPSAIDALEQTILQLAVRGQLVPQDPTDEPASAYVARLKPEPMTKRAKDIGSVLNDADAEGLPRGWCVTNVASIAECLDYMRKPVKKDDRNDANNAVPYYGANGQVGWIDDYIFDEDLVLVVEDETFIGRTKPFSYIVQGKSWVNNHAHVLRPLGGMSVGFLNLCLQKYDFIPLTSGTTNRRKLTKAGLLAAEFPLPPLPEQARIVARVAQLSRLCADLRQRLTQSQTTQAELAEALVAE